MKNDAKFSVRALALVAVLVVLAAGCGQRSGSRSGRGSGARGAAASPVPVPTSVATTASVHPSLSIAGIIAPLQNVAISSTLSEPADAVKVSEGDLVRKGQTIAVLDTQDLRAQLDSQERTAASADAKIAQAQYTAKLNYGQSPDQVTQARATLAQAQQTYAQASLDLRRDAQLLANGYVAQQAYDQQNSTTANDLAAVRSAQAALASAITNERVNGNPQAGLQAANVASARADAASAHAAAEQIQANLAKAVIVSPVDGVVVNRNLNVGEYPNGRTLFTIQEIANVYAELNASSAQVFALRRGSPVTLAVSGTGGRSYRGRVVAVLGQVQPGSTNFTVKVLVANGDGLLQSGVPVTGTVTLPPSNGIGIPTTAFLDDTHASVMVDKSGTATVADVKEVASDGTTSIVTGLSSGERVISDGQLGVTSGQKLAER